MKFPRLLETAVVSTRNGKVCFTAENLEALEDSIEEYNDWKRELGIEVLTPAKLRRLHQTGLFPHQVFELFKNNKKLDYLSVESKRRSRITRIK